MITRKRDQELCGREHRFGNKVDINLEVATMFKGLKKKIEGSQTVSSRKSPSRIDSKPGGPVRVSSTSEDPNETDSAQASGVHLRVSVEDKDQTVVVDGVTLITCSEIYAYP